MKNIFRKEVIIGLCVAMAIVILCFGIEFLKGINVFSPANFYIAEYENVEGLEVAAPVTIDGYKVGQVREINFNYEQPGKIQVLLALNKQLLLPADSKALIGSTLLSGSYVEIVRGSSKEMLPVGGIISSGKTPDLMSSISNEILPAVGDMMPKIDSLLLNVNGLLVNANGVVSSPAIESSLKNIQLLTNNLNATSKNLDVLMSREVPAVVRGAGVTMTRLDTVVANLSILSENLKALPLDQTLSNVNGLTSNLEKFTETLNNPHSTLGELTQDSELYDRLNRLTADIDSLIIDIKKNPKRYISIKLL